MDIGIHVCSIMNNCTRTESSNSYCIILYIILTYIKIIRVFYLYYMYLRTLVGPIGTQSHINDLDS